jgi:hypothetical protein
MPGITTSVMSRLGGCALVRNVWSASFVVLSGQDLITGVHKDGTEELPYRRIINYKSD